MPSWCCLRLSRDGNALLDLLRQKGATITADGPESLSITGMENRDVDIIGVWHSHTHTDAYPSPTDIRQAVDPMWVYVIVSMRDEVPMLRAYRLRDGSVAECQVVLEGRSSSL